MEEFLQSYGVGIVASCILIFILYAILDYCGLFYTFQVRTYRNQVGPLQVAYLYDTGSFRHSTKLFARVAKHAPHQRCIGIYYDDPKTTPEKQLRYMIGSVLRENDDPVDLEVKENLVRDGFRIVEFPAIDYAIGAIMPQPWIFSILFAIWRVYPKLERVIEQQRLNVGPCIEIYDGAKVHFYLPLQNHDAYYVPEAISDKSL